VKLRPNQTHFEVGRKVRQTIRELGGTMPENLPISENIDKAKKRLKKRINNFYTPKNFSA